MRTDNPSWSQLVVLAAVGSLVAAAPACAAPPAPDSGSIALRCGALIDGVSARATGPAVVVIEHGRIIELGTHAELIALRGHYFDLYRQQSLTEATRELTPFEPRLA